ncbi:MAG: pyrroline-5-carboxylate reductase [Lachnospiraceae bacterium]|nr:pyrroline-5-carboxylate reductase [Lachnospiraceae bacterium]
MKKYGFIGTGNMGYPLLVGAAELSGKENVTYSTPFIEEMESVKAKTGIDYSTDTAALAADSEIIVICVKPQMLKDVFNDLSKTGLRGKTIISIAAGVSCATLYEGIRQDVRIARIMPNTPAMVGEGMSCICFSDYSGGFDEAAKKDVTDLFEKVGKVEIIPESLMNAAICANGSSPAYVFMFIEALADSVVKYGIPRKTAYKLAAQTVLGSAKLVLESSDHPGALKDNVCSPGGTTIAAVEALEEWGFRNAVMKATDACYEKGVELGQKAKDKS